MRATQCLKLTESVPPAHKLSENVFGLAEQAADRLTDPGPHVFQQPVGVSSERDMSDFLGIGDVHCIEVSPRLDFGSVDIGHLSGDCRKILRREAIGPTGQCGKIQAPLFMERVQTVSAQDETEKLNRMPDRSRRILRRYPRSDGCFGGFPCGLIGDFGAEKPGPTGNDQKRLDRREDGNLESLIGQIGLTAMCQRGVEDGCCKSRSAWVSSTKSAMKLVAGKQRRLEGINRRRRVIQPGKIKRHMMHSKTMPLS